MTAEEPLRVGIVGTGSIGRKAHLPAWSRVPEAEVVAFADPDDDARRAARDRLAETGADPATGYESAAAMLESEDLDVADVTVRPEQGKAGPIQAALTAGCHVTCQKPFLHDYVRAEALVAHADRCDRFLSVNQQARFAGAFARARNRVEDGSLGSLRTIRLSADFDFPGENRWLDFSSHSFDLVRYWAGSEPTRVQAWHEHQGDDRYLLGVWLDFDDDLAAQIWDELASSTTLRWQFRLMGDGGSVRGHEAYFDGMYPSTVAYTPAGATEEQVERLDTSYVPDAFAAYFEAFAAAVRTGTDPPTPGRDNLETLRLAFAARESARRGEWVDPASLGADALSL